jgi:hypothetical protein
MRKAREPARALFHRRKLPETEEKEEPFLCARISRATSSSQSSSLDRLEGIDELPEHCF